MTYDDFKKLHGDKMPKARKPMEHQEDNLQKQCVGWFRQSYPDLAPLLFHPNNEAFYGGSKLHRQITGARMKDMGVTAGVADLILLVPSSGHHGICYELKHGRNGQQENQRQWQQAVTAQGYRYEVIKSLEAFKTITEQYLNITPKDQDQAAVERLFGPGFKAKIHDNDKP